MIPPRSMNVSCGSKSPLAAGERDAPAKDIARLEAIAGPAVQLPLAADENAVVDVGHVVLLAAGADDRPGVAAEFGRGIDPVFEARPDVLSRRASFGLGKISSRRRPIGRHPDEAAGGQAGECFRG